jgi:hypothetical protein
MEGVNASGLQQLVSLAVQKSALDTQASMVSTLMEGASAGMQQPDSLRAAALGEIGLGTRLNIVA